MRREVTRVDVLAQFDAVVLSQFPIQLAAPDVDGDDARRAALQEAIGKSARRSADVETDSARHFDPKMVERGGQLQTAPADERHWFADRQLHVNRNQLAGLFQSLSTAEDMTGED